jgi:hypothetical protein
VSGAAADSDGPAIASFLSIGFANAVTHFNAISGAPDGFESFQATQLPDRTHFTKCTVSHYQAHPAVRLREKHSYNCFSTPRPDATEALFKMAEGAVAANLPSGYAGTGEQHPHGEPYEVWSRTGSPDVRLWSVTLDGIVDYELSIEVDP